MPRRRRSEANVFRVLLDEGAPVSVGQVFQRHNFEVLYHWDVLPSGAADMLVAKHAMLNAAVLVAIDNDMKRISGRYGKADPKFERLNLIKLMCSEPQAAARVEQAMSFLDLEWRFACEKVARRLFVEIGPHFLRTHR